MTGTPLKDGDYIPAGRAPGQLADVADGARESLEQITALLEGHPRRQGHGRQAVHRRRALQGDHRVRDRRGGCDVEPARRTGHARRCSRIRRRTSALNASLADLQEMTRRINAGEGSLGRLLKDDALAKSLTGDVGNLEDMTGRLKRERQHDGQAPDRERALRPVQLGRRACRCARVGHPEGGRDPAAAAAQQTVV